MNSALHILDPNYNYTTTMPRLWYTGKQFILREKMKRPLVDSLRKIHFVSFTKAHDLEQNALLMKDL